MLWATYPDPARAAKTWQAAFKTYEAAFGLERLNPNADHHEKNAKL